EIARPGSGLARTSRSGEALICDSSLSARKRLAAASICSMKRSTAAFAAERREGRVTTTRSSPPRARPSAMPGVAAVIGLLRALQRQRQHRTCGHRILRVRHEVIRDRTWGDDRVAPVVEAHELREQLRAEAVSIASDAIDCEMGLRAHAMRLGCDDSARQCGG